MRVFLFFSLSGRIFCLRRRISFASCLDDWLIEWFNKHGIPLFRDVSDWTSDRTIRPSLREGKYASHYQQLLSLSDQAIQTSANSASASPSSFTQSFHLQEFRHRLCLSSLVVEDKGAWWPRASDYPCPSAFHWGHNPLPPSFIIFSTAFPSASFAL